MMTPKTPTDVRVEVSIPQYKSDNTITGSRLGVALKGDIVMLGVECFKRQDLEEALRVLGHKPGPVFRGDDCIGGL